MVQRVFMQDVGQTRDGEPRWRRGDVRDWPLATWKGFPHWQQVTKPLDEVVSAGVRDVQAVVDLPGGREQTVTHQRVDLDAQPPKRRGPGRPPKQRSA